MRPFRQRLARLLLPVAAAMICVGPFQSANAERTRLNSSKIQNWTLANGELIQADIINYSRQSRIITLELPSGTRVHVAPRDLAGASKFDWLTSDAFIQSLSGYRVPPAASLALVKSFLAILAGSILGLFLAFWIAVSLLTNHRSFRRAGIAFFKFFLFASFVAAIGITAAWGAGKMLSHTSYSTIAISIVYLITIGVMIAMTCRIIGRTYEASEWTGIQALTLSVVLFGAGTLVLIIGMPRALNQPGVDEWLTEQVLTPLQLA